MRKSTTATPCKLTRRRDSSTVCFFFQAEDGIRDHCVTGVQTCALPISAAFQRLEVFVDEHHPFGRRFFKAVAELQSPERPWLVCARGDLASETGFMIFPDRKSVV